MSILYPEHLVSAALPPSDSTRERKAYPFESDLYRHCWWTHLAPRFDIPVKNGDLLIHRKSLRNPWLSLRVLRIAGWNNAWDQDFTPERLAEMRDMEETTGWDYFRLVWNEDRRAFQAFEHLNAGEYLILDRPAPCNYVIEMGQGGYEGYLQSLSHNGRKSLKKKLRRAEPLSPELRLVQCEAEIDDFFAQFIPLHIQYWSEKTGQCYLQDSHEQAFILNWAKALHASGNLVMDRVLLDNQTVSMSMGAIYGDTFYWLLTINTGACQEYVPGMVGLSLRLQYLASQGITRFNMGSGDYFYKVQNANSREMRRELVVCNPRSWKGQLYHRWMRKRWGQSAQELPV